MGRATSADSIIALRLAISIHALRGEGDRNACKCSREKGISIHALRGEGDYACPEAKINLYIFQSTPSVGRATLPELVLYSSVPNFNPRPPWGGRPHAQIRIYTSSIFQSTPSVGRATSACSRTAKAMRFQSTPSVGRATIKDAIYSALGGISIHALRGEGDKECGHNGGKASDFNPRPPWGGRRQILHLRDVPCNFNPRPPWGGRRFIFR